LRFSREGRKRIDEIGGKLAFRRGFYGGAAKADLIRWAAMSVTVHVSPQLQPLTGKDSIVLKGSPGTLAEVIEELEAKHPGVRERLIDDDGLREWVKVYIGGKEAYAHLGGLQTRVRPDSELTIDVPARAKVTFVQEHREVEVEPGRTIKQIALDIGIDPNRKYQRLISCEGLGIFDGCLCWVKAKSKGALNRKTFTERALHDLKGWQRLACQARVFGDVEIWTLPQGDERIREPRPIASPPPMPNKRERFLESIFRTPAPDDEEGDAGTKPAAKKMPTDTKAPMPTPIVPPTVPVDMDKVAANLGKPAIPDAVEAAIDQQKIERKQAHPGEVQGEPGPSEPRSGVLDAGAKNEQMPAAQSPARPETAFVEKAAEEKGETGPESDVAAHDALDALASSNVKTPMPTGDERPTATGSEPPTAAAKASRFKKTIAGVASPIYVPVEGASPRALHEDAAKLPAPKGADEPKAVDDASPSQGERTAMAESSDDATNPTEATRETSGDKK
jgi:molybdopterin synthase sulfur carrier subunit